MRRICSIVEGYGDVKAIPSLIAKTTAAAGKPAVSPNPIRAGEWAKIRREGELERLLTLAESRKWNQILIITDLDDDCPVEESASVRDRIETWKDGRDIKISLVFLKCEYEVLFLQAPSCLGEYDPAKLPDSPDEVRAAKGAVKAVIGKRYKETEDQLIFTNRLDLDALRAASRCFRKLEKEIC